MIQKEQEAHNEEINNFVNDIISIRECLTDARVMSRLVPAYRQLAVQSTIPNHLYAQTFEATMLNPSEPHPGLNPTDPRPSTPCPPLRPTNPEPPSPEPLPIHITTPADMSMPGAMPVPPPIDYTTRNPCGPHHMPSMFDEENSRNPLPPRFRKFTWEPKGHCCKYCEAYGRHWNNHCPEPHRICNTKQRCQCIILLEHKYFDKACHWGGRTRNNFPVEDQHIRKTARRKEQRLRTRNTSVATINETTGSPATSFTPMDLDIDNLLRPADSLLFSPHPITVFNSKKNFNPSDYQGLPPPPGTWGNMPWGTNWNDTAAHPSSPCIFDYGREGEDPLYLHHYDRREDLLCCTEEDLPSAQLHPDNYLDESTMAMVDAYTKHKLET